MANFLDVLQDRVLLGDGATGTYLYARGVPVAHCLEEVNLSQPDLVADVYRSYAQAGAMVVETNSFGANRIRLARYGLEDHAAEINARAAWIAKEALAGTDVFIGGSVGPLSLRPTDPVLTVDDQRSIFREQIGALLDGGVDVVFLETFADMDELMLALDVFKKLSDKPVVTSLAVSEEGQLFTGQDLATGWKQLRAAGANVVSINGTCGLRSSLSLLEEIDVEPGDLIGVFPNAGKPEFYEGRFNYAASPEYFARNLPLLVREGARLIGGDYGTEPRHIAAMAQALQGLKPVSRKLSRHKRETTPHPIEVFGGPATEPPAGSVVAIDEPVQEESLLDQLDRRIVSIVELDSPKGLSMTKFLTGVKALKDAGAAAVTLADNSLAILRVSNFAAAVLIREKVGLTPLIHLACRDRNLIGLQSELLGLGVLGFRNVLAITGDPARVGDYPGATSVYDVNSVGLIKLLKGMNDGVNQGGKSLNGHTKFVIGCAFNPNASNLDNQVKKLEMKIRAGAQYVMTQPVFDPKLVHETARRLKPLGIPVFVGVMPLMHSRNAEFLHNEVPGIKIDDTIRERLRNVDDAEGAKIGLEVAHEIRSAILEHFRGIYIITPFLKYEMSLGLL